MRIFPRSRCRNTLPFNHGHAMLVIILFLLLTIFTCGCSKVDPEELGPGESMPGPAVTPQPPWIIPPTVTTLAVPTPLPRAALPGEW